VDTLVRLLVEPLSFEFMQRGMVAAVMVGVVCAVIGAFVVLRGLAFMGDALAHAVLPGVAVAFLLGQSIFIGAFVAGIATALGIGLVQRESRLREDTAVGIMFVGAFALGIALLSRIKSYSVDLAHILFGNVLAVSPQDLWLIAGFGGIVLGVLLFLYKEFLVLSFDPIMAATTRLPVTWLNNLLLILLSLTIVISLRAVGNVLVVAMLIAPAAAAYQLTTHFPRMMALGAVFGAASAVLGLYASYWLDVASGASIVLTSVIIFFLTLLATRGRRVWA
jgi:manganese/iron transport system permease protein